MRILMLNYEYPPLGGGAANACHCMLKEFAKNREIEIDLITSSEKNIFETEQFSDTITIFKINVKKEYIHHWKMIELARWTCRTYRLAREMAERNHYDLCHCWFGWPSGVIGYMLRSKMPYLIALRGSDIPGYNPRLKIFDSLLFAPLSKIVWKHACCVTTLSLNSTKMAKKVLNLNYKIIHNGVDINEFYPDVRKSNQIRLLSIGRLTERKNIDDVILATKEVHQRYPEKSVHLSIVGSGNQDLYLRNLVHKLELEDNVSFMGAIPHEKLPVIYRNHDIFILASMNEALGNVTQEAISSGLALLTTDTGAAELLDNNGYIVNTKDYKDIADKIGFLINNPTTLLAFKKQSARIAHTMTWYDCTDSYIKIYKIFCSNKWN